MSKRDKKLENAQKGPQQHAEGQHGSKTHGKFVENLHERLDPVNDDVVIARDTTGRHRLYEDRQQHDEADKNSEQNRARREHERGRTTIEGDAINGGKTRGTPGQF